MVSKQLEQRVGTAGILPDGGCRPPHLRPRARGELVERSRPRMVDVGGQERVPGEGIDGHPAEAGQGDLRPLVRLAPADRLRLLPASR